MELWIARDKDGCLSLYTGRPVRLEIRQFFSPEDCCYFDIDETMFPEVTWENSPKKVRIELIEE